jgi:hypothetical protein
MGRVSSSRSARREFSGWTWKEDVEPCQPAGCVAHQNQPISLQTPHLPRVNFRLALEEGVPPLHLVDLHGKRETDPERIIALQHFDADKLISHHTALTLSRLSTSVLLSIVQVLCMSSHLICMARTSNVSRGMLCQAGY